MSEPVTAMNNAHFEGGIAQVRELGPLGMITLRGDLASSALKNAAKSAGGVNMPDRGHVLTQAQTGLAWMSPDELLVLCAYDEADKRLANLHNALAKQHALAVNVSDARAVFEVKGRHAREVIAKLAPVDLDPSVFTPGMFRRSRLAQVPAAFWMPDPVTFHIICFRSVGQYVFDLLCRAAQPGSEVGHFNN